MSTQANIAARNTYNLARSHKARLEVRGVVVKATLTFTPDDREAFATAQGNASQIIGSVPAKGGSTWGDDGIAAMVALKEGRLTLNVSGVQKSFAKELASFVNG